MMFLPVPASNINTENLQKIQTCKNHNQPYELNQL